MYQQQSLRFVFDSISSNDNSWKQILVPTCMQSFRPCADSSQCVDLETGVMYLNGRKNELLTII